MMRLYLSFLILMCWSTVMFGQVDALANGPQMGVRLGYSLELPSSSNFRGEDFTFFEAGHRIAYGAFLNLRADKNVQFVPYLGLEHVFWPKSLGYSSDCALDSFPTFWSTSDSLPGRDFRVYNIAFEPGFKFYNPRLSIFFKLQLFLSYSIRVRAEDYTHSCGAGNLSRSWLVYESDEFRENNPFNLGIGGGIVKEVKVGKESFLALEPGIKATISPIFKVFDANPNGPFFTMNPWAIFLNISLQR